MRKNEKHVLFKSLPNILGGICMTNKKTLTEVAAQIENDKRISLTDLEEALDAYFFEGEGQIFAPWSEERPKKPGRKIYQLLANMGFDFVSDSVTLEGTDYIFTIMVAEMDWVTVRIDYWNWEIHFD